MQGLPSKFTAGDSFSWNHAATTDYLGTNIRSDDGWSLVYNFRGNKSGATLELTGVADGSGGWDFTMSADDSELFADLSLVYWGAKASKSTDRRTLASGSVAVEVDLSAVSSVPYDGSSQAEKDLLAVRAAMRAMISGGAVQDYSVAGRSVRKMQMSDLILLESKLKVEVQREKQAASVARGDTPKSSLYVRFR